MPRDVIGRSCDGSASTSESSPVTEYLDLDDALYAYAEAVEVPFGQAGDALLNRGQLESALARPQNAAA